MAPDGTKIAYVHTVDTGDTTLNYVHILNLTTGKVFDFNAATGLMNTADVAWSPDGTKLAFGGKSGSGWRLYTANPDGSNLTPISDPADGFAGNAAWSPDGSTIAFFAYGADPQVLKLVQADGSNERAIAQGVLDPSWSPDGTRLVVTDFAVNGGQLRIIDTDGNVLDTFTNPRRQQEPAWSPDGNYIVFTRMLTNSYQLWVHSLGPAIPDAVPPTPPSVSINSGAIYTNSTDVNLRVSAPDGAQSITVSNDGGFDPSQTFSVAQQVPWTLVSSGADRLPKIVYVRFDHSGPVYTDDIILDQTSPQISSASVTGTGTVSRTLTMRASDNRSGVHRIQVNRRGTAHGAKTYRFRKRTRIPAWRHTYVRVRDGARNWSHWRLARRH